MPNAYWLGLTIYGISFVLVALGWTSLSPDTKFFGFHCASFSFFYPWVEARDVLFHHVPPLFGPLAYISLLVSGWINPLFIFVALLDWADSQQRLASILRKVILAMIPFAWLFSFYAIRTFPREGHFLWIIGMLFTLYPRQF
jgi:hypothetical protein